MAINLTLIGTLLTVLVVAREWERGTMESLLATPTRRWEMLAGKIIPYFVLGMVAMAISVSAAIWLFGVPFRGSIGALVTVSAAYLATMLALGLFISTRTKNQFVACQAGAHRRLPASIRALRVHLRDRQHAPADPAAHARVAAPVFRVCPPDTLPGRGRVLRARPQLLDTLRLCGRAVFLARSGYPDPAGVRPCSCVFVA